MERKFFIYIVNRMLATEFFTTLKTRAALLSCQVSVGNLHIFYVRFHFIANARKKSFREIDISLKDFF